MSKNYNIVDNNVNQDIVGTPIGLRDDVIIHNYTHHIQKGVVSKFTGNSIIIRTTWDGQWLRQVNYRQSNKSIFVLNKNKEI